MTSVKLAPAAKKSLALQKDGVFRLLVVLTAILGWIVAVGCGGLVLMQSVYTQWHLERSTEVSIYLMAEAPTQKINKLEEALLTTPHIDAISRMTEEDVQALITPYLSNTENDNNVPLPIILNLKVAPSLNYEELTAQVQNLFPQAEIDDTRSLLSAAAKGVRMAQILALVLSLSLFVIMAFLVTLTVRTGLRAQQETLAVLRYIGSTDAFLTKLVVQQVTRRALMGWGIGVIMAAMTFAILIVSWPLLQTYTLKSHILPLLIATILVCPLVLPLLTYVASRKATGKMLRK